LPRVTYSLSLHDALPIYGGSFFYVQILVQGLVAGQAQGEFIGTGRKRELGGRGLGIQLAVDRDFSSTRGGVDFDVDSVAACAKEDRKSTRLNSSHLGISY